MGGMEKVRPPSIDLLLAIDAALRAAEQANRAAIDLDDRVVRDQSDIWKQMTKSKAALARSRLVLSQLKPPHKA